MLEDLGLTSFTRVTTHVFIRKMALWEDGETLKLLKLWSEESVQALLEGSVRNKNAGI